MEKESVSNPADTLRTRILSLTFNQNNTVLCIGTTTGFRLFRIEDGKCTSSHDSRQQATFEGGFSVVSSMFSTQLLLLVGSAENEKHNKNVLYFWDEYQSQFKAEVRFRTPVKKVLMRRDKIVIVLEKITYIYLLNTLKPVASIATIENEHGVGSISNHQEIFVLGTLDINKGHVRIENFYVNEVKTGQMHDNSIVRLEINFEGSLGATASELGTVIRVFETNSLAVRHELRRGSSSATITSLSFSPNNQYLVAGSNKMTIHVWSLAANESYVGMVTRFLPGYFQPTRSYFKLPIHINEKWSFSDEIPSGPVTSFLSSNRFLIAHLDGNLYYCTINSDAVVIDKSTSYLEKGEVYHVDSK